MSLIDYKVPKFKKQLPTGVRRLLRTDRLGVKYVAHAHFIKGTLVYDSTCKHCVGILKPKKTASEIAERNRMKYQYYFSFLNID